MFRRSFFKAIGGAVLGTAIALKLPETLVPRPPIDLFKMTIILNKVMDEWWKSAFGFEKNFEYVLKVRNV